MEIIRFYLHRGIDMAQDKFRINGAEVFQPDCDMAFAYETTYTEGSGRVKSGSAKITPMFTVEQYSYSASNVPMADASKILKMVVGKTFRLHYFSVYHGKWRDAKFYVGQLQSSSIQTLKNNHEMLKTLSFNAEGMEKLV